MKKSLIYNLRRKCQVIAYNILTPEILSKIYFRIVVGKNLNLKNPQTFNEKLQWLKLYYWPQNEDAIICADKYKVREYLMQKGYGEYLNDLYGVWKSADDIDWDSLPEQFVLKCNHGCGYNILCPDKSKLNIEEAKKQLNKWLKEDFSKFNAEPHYAKIEPYIICEKFLGGNIVDYKYFCFNGEAEFMYIAEGFGEGIGEKISFFDKDGNKAPYKRLDYPTYDDVQKPEGFEKMKKMSEELSKDFPFVRMDWFEVDGKIYFGEFTFTPCGCMMKLDPDSKDAEWGKLINL